MAKKSNLAPKQKYIKNKWSDGDVITAEKLNKIETGIEINTLTKMDRNVYDTNDDNIVDVAEKIQGIDESGNNTYYGKNNNGDIGFHELPKNDTQIILKAGKGIDISNNTVNTKFDNKTIGLNNKGELEAKISTGGNDEGNTNIKQYIIKDIKSGTLYTIEDEGLPINHKLIPSVFSLENSKQNTTTITDFKLNIEDISSDNGIKLQDNYKLDVNSYESEIVNKSIFNKIVSFKGGT